MADSHSATGEGIDCFASPFGHTSFRCAGLEVWQSRLLMLPVTLFLVGALLALCNWIRLALNQRIFKRRHFALLVLYGFLVFSLGIADKVRPAGQGPAQDSRVIGGISILPDILLVAVIYHFLPPHVALPWWLDRALAASSFSGLILMLLGAIREYTPDGLDDADRNNIYAASACELVFLISSLFASQYARYFAVMGEHGRYRTFVNLDASSNLLFVLSLLAVIAQTCLSFLQPPHFSYILSASLLGAVAYSLLICMSIVQHLNTSDDHNDCVVAIEPKESSLHEKNDDEGIEERVASTNGALPSKHEEDNIDANSDFRVAERYLQATENLNDDPRAARTGTGEHRLTMPDLEPAHGPDAGSVVWHGNCESRMRVQSGMSASSWGRLETIMRARKQSATRRSGFMTTPHSRATFYGSESSFPEVISPATGRTSVLSSKANWRTTLMGFYVPPVPTIAPKFMQRSASPSHNAFAMPLTPGETPIPLDVAEPKSTGDLSPNSRSKAGLSSWTGFFWRKKNDDTGRKENSEDRFSPNTFSGRGEPPQSFDVGKASMSSVKASSSNATLHGSYNRAESRKAGLPPQYQSSKLFPLPCSSTGEENIRGNSVPDMEDFSNLSEEGHDIMKEGIAPLYDFAQCQQRTATKDAHQESRCNWGQTEKEAHLAAQSPMGKHEMINKNKGREDDMTKDCKGASQFDAQRLFATSFRSARNGAEHTIEEETEPTSDAVMRGGSSQSRTSDLSITVESDQSSPREGKLQKETQSCNALRSRNARTSESSGAVMRRQISDSVSGSGNADETDSRTNRSLESNNAAQQNQVLNRRGSAFSRKAPPSRVEIPPRKSATAQAIGGDTRPPPKSSLRGQIAAQAPKTEIGDRMRSIGDDDDANTIREEGTRR